MGRCHRPWLILDASEMVRHYYYLLRFLSLGSHSSSSRCVQVGLSVSHGSYPPQNPTKNNPPSAPPLIHPNSDLPKGWAHEGPALCKSYGCFPRVFSTTLTTIPQGYQRELWCQTAWVHILTPSVNSCVALRNSLNFFNNLKKLVFVTCLNSDQLHKCLV